MSKADHERQYVITEDKFKKYSNCYNGINAAIKAFEEEGQIFLESAARFHQIPVNELLIKFKSLGFHQLKSKILNDCDASSSILPPICKKASKLFEKLKITFENNSVEDDEDYSQLPTDHLLENSHIQETLIKDAKHYDGIIYTIENLKLKQNDYVTELSTRTNMLPSLVISLLEQNKTVSHENILELMNKGFKLVYPEDFNYYCHSTQHLIVALREDRLDLNVRLEEQPLTFLDSANTYPIVKNVVGESLG